MNRIRVAVLLTAMFLTAIAAPAGAQTQLLVISGIGGETRYSDLFHGWSLTLIDAARDRLGIPDENITYLAEQPQRDPANIDGIANKEGIATALRTLAQQTQPDDTLFIVLFGHGSAGEQQALFNLPGPDISAAEFEQLLQPLGERRLAFINTTASSGPFLARLAGPNRAIITATESANERYHTLFGGHFVAAFADSSGADTNKDRQVSLLEAFTYAERETQRAYDDERRLRTEHALLDDNGDGEGSREISADALTNSDSDGGLAAALYLRGPLVNPAAADNPELAAIMEQKALLEQQIADLRRRKNELDDDDYATQLEDLLIELALLNRELQAAEPESETETETESSVLQNEDNSDVPQDATVPSIE